MLRILHHPSSPFGMYQSGTQSLWPPGEVREVEDSDGRYLLNTFPGAFVIDEPEPAAESPKGGPITAPHRSMALKAPDNARATPTRKRTRKRKAKNADEE